MIGRKVLFFTIIIALILTMAVNAEILNKGCAGDSVKNLQIKLINNGYLDSEVTGYFGDQTSEAVKKFQKVKGLEVDGIVGDDTNNALQNFGTSISIKTDGIEVNIEVIKEIQRQLGNKGFYKGEIDGIFGSITETAIKNFQKSTGLAVDGIVGPKTLDVLYNKTEIVTIVKKEESVSRGNAERIEMSNGTYGEMLDWWTEVQSVFPRGKEAVVVDFKTGESFNIKRTYGGNHADCETLTKEDTQKMKEIWGGEWSWDRRPVFIVIGDRALAASMIGMPHAGLDSQPANVYVKGRSGGFGAGTNLDTVKGNGMNGHFCVHFLNSRTHGTNKVDDKHQANIKIAAGK